MSRLHLQHIRNGLLIIHKEQNYDINRIMNGLEVRHIKKLSESERHMSHFLLYA